jgi:RNA 3'-phosphate cyclase
MRPIEIDGSYLEAGGQIVRTASGLSVATGKPFTVFNIRKGRPEQGLKAQHLAGVKAAAEICAAKVKGAELLSTELEFSPGRMRPGDYTLDIGTAGSIPLVLQTLMIPSAVFPGKVSFGITGGTDVRWSPSMTYFQHVFAEWLKAMGVKVFTRIARYGYYPKGGGSVKVEVEPAESLKPLAASSRGDLQRLGAWSIASESLKERKVAERQLESAQKLIGRPDYPMVAYVKTLSPGSSVHLQAYYSNCWLGAGSVGEMRKSAEEVGREAAMLLKAQMESGACMDRWMADQILPFLALAAPGGKSEVAVAEITSHCTTNAWVVEKFLPVKIELEGEKGKPGRISVSKIA